MKKKYIKPVIKTDIVLERVSLKCAKADANCSLSGPLKTS